MKFKYMLCAHRVEKNTFSPLKLVIKARCSLTMIGGEGGSRIVAVGEMRERRNYCSMSVRFNFEFFI